jgi:SAM-dependent methyltransferase
MPTDSKQRFSNRVDDYVRYRPGYPAAILEVLRSDCALTPQSAIADIGSGTGLLAQLFLANGNRVFGVEPNADMRRAGEEFLREFTEFRSVPGSAEETTLPGASVDFVVAGQAFHWFNPQLARREFARILRQDGWVAVISNERKKDGTPFLRDYEILLRDFGTDYGEVDKKYPQGEKMEQFFGAGNFREANFPNEQVFDFAGLRGRLLSSSFTPVQGHPRHEPMLERLRQIFDAHARGGQVRFDYIARLFYGHL